MKKKLLLIFLGTFLLLAQAFAQQITVTGKVSSSDGPIPGVSIRVKGTTVVAQTNGDGNYSIKALKTDVLTFTYVGYAVQEKSVGNNTSLNVFLEQNTNSLNEVVVTALGQKVSKKSLGTSQQEVKGQDLANTQRENFINAMQGRIAGVEVTSTSGIPGASTSITIRGVSSISGSNQPLFVVDGLPIDNKTLNTSAFYSDNSSTTAFSNRGVDFTNRAADINPEDIESLVVLKGPEAAALYGIDAANGAIVITTKRGKSGKGSINYSNSFRLEKTNTKPEIQNVFGLGAGGIPASGTLQYFGPAYAPGTVLYDNIDGFFQTALTQKHNLSLDGGSQDMSYRISTSYTEQNGVVPNSNYDRFTLNGSTNGKLNEWLKVDLSMTYTYAVNNQPFKGSGGPLIGLLLWPQEDDAKNYLTPAGTRRRFTTATDLTSEIENPYFNVNKNKINSIQNRITSNFGFTITPVKWLNLKSNVGFDVYSNKNLLLSHPESSRGFNKQGIMDVANDNTRNVNIQNLLNLTKQKITSDLSIDATLGNAIQDLRSNIDAQYGEGFLDPNFVSINNTTTTLRNAKSSISQRRLFSLFGRATLNYKDYLYITATGRNDWTSTIPIGANSFFYPSVSGSFVFTEVPAFKESLSKIFTSGKLRAAFANVGKDARPYSYVPSLESKSTVGGGFGYGFTGPNLALRPEFASSYELGTELAFFKDRLGLDVTVYRKETSDQIVNDIRGSYATGYVLFNLNGASTRSEGLEITLRGTPIKTNNFTWNALVNFESARARVLTLPNSLPETYVSDTNIYGTIRNGTTPGYSTRSLTGTFYLRNTNGDILINPASGLPVRSSVVIQGQGEGYDRQPDFSIGITNSFAYKNFSLSFLLDIRKGGDVLNATQSFLTARGLSTMTLDRLTPRIVTGVLQDGKENSANPTVNNISVTPFYQNTYYTNLSEELFIEKDINWIRLKDVTLQYKLPQSVFRKQNFVKSASVFVTGTDLFLITNYSGLDPVVNGNTAAVGGSGASGIDYGNFPIPIGLNFGVRIGL
ncbi:SusC/RagA family TonB-linked outer membrane protein [Pedobacter yonginense]|uniref:SusC/RagA family TonB-linked outer membrane protein n=1 Tax=Pedobacter yonginense TaxID=651869 RepID=A0A317ELP2_9SPHI|nr:SusC/RagA family TonB-linked outer membrane protein [Pedobacter yonginense]PWS27780.1 SusC/RagA family TonB-linked outer membrane protein [Pedobacter yonginense]